MNTFSGNPLDRVPQQRLDDDWLAARLADDGSRFLPLHRLEVLVKKDGSGLAWARRGLLARAGREAETVLLGVRDGVAHYAVDVSAVDDPEAALGVGAVAEFSDVRFAASRLDPTDSAIVAQARALMDWHTTHPFCARCGRATVSEQGGALRRCGSCPAEHFPRVNPVVIMLVVRGERCLLGRQAGWPPGMFSTLAGFVETGETVEEAVRREVFEESAIEVGEVRYHSSQPWPFPSSLMIGCVAEGLSEDIVADTNEVEEVRWFPREIVRQACGPEGSSELNLPPPLAIGRRLCDGWVGLDG